MEVKDLIRQIQVYPATVIVVAGCSFESGMPLANELQPLFWWLISEFSEEFRPNTISGEAWNPREYYTQNTDRVWAQIGRIEKIKEHFRQSFKAICSRTEPSLFHRKLVRLLASGRITRILTLNWDDLIERAYEQEFGHPMKVCNSPQTFSLFNQLIKLHGDVRNLNQPWVLLNEDANVFPGLTPDYFADTRTVLVIGYREADEIIRTKLIKPLERESRTIRVAPDLDSTKGTDCLAMTGVELMSALAELEVPARIDHYQRERPMEFLLEQHADWMLANDDWLLGCRWSGISPHDFFYTRSEGLPFYIEVDVRDVRTGRSEPLSNFLLQDDRSIILLGGTGSGKTVVQLKCFHDCVNRGHPLSGKFRPIWLQPKLAGIGDLVQAIADTIGLTRFWSDPKHSFEKVSEWLRQTGPLLLFIDLNELIESERHQLLNSVEQFLSRPYYSKHRIIVAYRAEGAVADDSVYARLQSDPPVRLGVPLLHLEMQHLPKEKALHYYRTVRGVTLDSIDSLERFVRYHRDLIERPLLLHLITMVSVEGSGDNLGGLFAKAVDQLVKRLSPHPALTHGKTLTLLDSFGRTMMERGASTLSLEEFRILLYEFNQREWWPRWPDGARVSIDDVQHALFLKGSLITNRGERIALLHDSLIYFFAARSLLFRQHDLPFSFKEWLGNLDKAKPYHVWKTALQMFSGLLNTEQLNAFIDRWASQWSEKPYGADFLPELLWRTGRFDELYNILSNPDFRRHKRKLYGTDAAYLDDIQYAIRSCSKEAKGDLARLTAFCALDACLRTNIARINETLIRLIVRRGQLARARVLADSQKELEYQLSMLIAIGLEVSTSDFVTARIYETEVRAYIESSLQIYKHHDLEKDYLHFLSIMDIESALKWLADGEWKEYSRRVELLPKLVKTVYLEQEKNEEICSRRRKLLLTVFKNIRKDYDRYQILVHYPVMVPKIPQQRRSTFLDDMLTIGEETFEHGGLYWQLKNRILWLESAAQIEGVDTQDMRRLIAKDLVKIAHPASLNGLVHEYRRACFRYGLEHYLSSNILSTTKPEHDDRDEVHALDLIEYLLKTVPRSGELPSVLRQIDRLSDKVGCLCSTVRLGAKRLSESAITWLSVTFAELIAPMKEYHLYDAVQKMANACHVASKGLPSKITQVLTNNIARALWDALQSNQRDAYYGVHAYIELTKLLSRQEASELLLNLFLDIDKFQFYAKSGAEVFGWLAGAAAKCNHDLANRCLSRAIDNAREIAESKDQLSVCGDLASIALELGNVLKEEIFEQLLDTVELKTLSYREAHCRAELIKSTEHLSPEQARNTLEKIPDRIDQLALLADVAGSMAKKYPDFLEELVPTIQDAVDHEQFPENAGSYLTKLALALHPTHPLLCDQLLEKVYQLRGIGLEQHCLYVAEYFLPLNLQKGMEFVGKGLQAAISHSHPHTEPFHLLLNQFSHKFQSNEVENLNLAFQPIQHLGDWGQSLINGFLLDILRNTSNLTISQAMSCLTLLQKSMPKTRISALCLIARRFSHDLSILSNAVKQAQNLLSDDQYSFDFALPRIDVASAMSFLPNKSDTALKIIEQELDRCEKWSFPRIVDIILASQFESEIRGGLVDRIIRIVEADAASGQFLSDKLKYLYPEIAERLIPYFPEKARELALKIRDRHHRALTLSLLAANRVKQGSPDAFEFCRKAFDEANFEKGERRKGWHSAPGRREQIVDKQEMLQPVLSYLTEYRSKELLSFLEYCITQSRTQGSPHFFEVLTALLPFLKQISGQQLIAKIQSNVELLFTTLFKGIEPYKSESGPRILASFSMGDFLGEKN